jgi:hypothetical protein
VDKSDSVDFQVLPTFEHWDRSSYQGITTDSVLVHSSDSSENGSNSPSLASSIAGKSVSNEDFAAERDTLDWSDSADFNSDNQILPPAKYLAPLAGPENHGSLLSSYARRQILAPYFEVAATTQAPLGHGRLWTTLLPDMQNVEPSLELSILALATARLGKESNDDRLMYQSLNIYGRALKLMQLALWDPKRMYSDQVLGACMLLTMYEVIECPSRSRLGYISHQNGCGRLVELRGPKAHVRGLGHAIFLQYRYIASMETLLNKSTFLTNQEWMTIPWSETPKEVLDGFLDVFLGGSAILCEADRLQSTKNPRDLMAISVQVINRCWDFDAELESFYQSLKTAYGKPLFWPTISSDDSPHADSLAATRLEFAEPKIATTLMLYWATLTVLWSGMTHMYNLIDEVTEKIIPTVKKASSDVDMSQIYKVLGLPERGRSRDFIVTARKLLQSVDFCMKGELSMRTTVPPMTMVLDVLLSWTKFQEEIDFARARLAFVEKNGMRIVPYIAILKSN